MEIAMVQWLASQCNHRTNITRKNRQFIIGVNENISLMGLIYENYDNRAL